LQRRFLHRLQLRPLRLAHSPDFDCLRRRGRARRRRAFCSAPPMLFHQPSGFGLSGGNAGCDIGRRACRHDCNSKRQNPHFSSAPLGCGPRVIQLIALRLEVSYFIQIHKYASIKIRLSGAISGSEPQTDARLCSAY